MNFCMTFSSVWLFHLYDFFTVWLFHLYDFFIRMTFSLVWLFHSYDFFIRMTFSFVWLFHSYDFFIRMTFSLVWLFHSYDFFTRMTFSSVWFFHLYDFFICMRFSCVWILLVDFAREFCSRILFANFACEFCSWILFVSFHLWIFICKFSSMNFSFERSTRTKYANEVCKRSIFWRNDHHTNIFLQCEVNLHHYITSSHVFFKFHVFVIFTSLSSFFIKLRKFSKRTNFSSK
jgi:hypothetical protein